MAQRPDLRERRRRETRRHISRVALDLVLERGLAEVTVEEIAETAGVCPRTFFNYFPSKHSAVIPGPEPPAADAVERFVADRAVPVLDGLLALLTEHITGSPDIEGELCRVQRAVLTYPELALVLHQRVDEFEALLADAVGRRLDAGPGDRRPLVAAAVAGTLLRVVLMTRRCAVPAGAEPGAARGAPAAAPSAAPVGGEARDAQVAAGNDDWFTVELATAGAALRALLDA